ncbi:MAG: PepSY domain-containing protein [Prevotella sp.]|jgi:uncharacterized iron-regulated membrane protein|nr:PepSY-associated TM helix domain-containing protein [Prevotella sp.]MCH3993465.1 PepSY domain-containing protein [Prevotella sp.]
MKTRTLTKKLHLWLGLLSGIVIFIMAVTGCFLVFANDIESAGTPALYVRKGQVLLDPGTLKAQVERQIRIQPTDSQSTVTGITYGPKGKPATATCILQGGKYTELTINPYTGKIMHYPFGKDFFNFIFKGHRSLWLPPAIGGPVIGWSIVIFVFELLSGIILWLPRKWNKHSARSRMLIQWRTSVSSRLYSLHNTLGGYVLIFAFLIAFTGLTWSFSSLSKVYYSALTGRTYQEWTSPLSDTTAVDTINHADIQLWKKIRHIYPVGQQGTLQFNFPKDHAGAYTICYNPVPGRHYTNEYRFYDQYTLKELSGGGNFGIRNSSLTTGDKIFRMSFDIHSGSIAGLPGNILAFLVSLIIASLPVTGFLMWWRRRKVHKKSKQKPKS